MVDAVSFLKIAPDLFHSLDNIFSRVNISNLLFYMFVILFL